MVLAELGHSVVIIEQESELMKRASFNNQARLHTGLHYPRSLLTAQESLTGYHKFRKRYGEAVSDFAVAESAEERDNRIESKVDRHLGDHASADLLRRP